jgi:hypothetical protein
LERLGLGLGRGGESGFGAAGRAKIEAIEFWVSGLFSVMRWLPFNISLGFGEDWARRWAIWTTRVVSAAEWSDVGRMGISWPEFTGWGCERLG